MNICLFVPHAFIYYFVDSNEKAREGFCKKKPEPLYQANKVTSRQLVSS